MSDEDYLAMCKENDDAVAAEEAEEDEKTELVRLRRENAALASALQAMITTWEAYLTSPNHYRSYHEAKAIIKQTKSNGGEAR